LTPNHLSQDVYSWAGEYRTVRISKGGNPFWLSGAHFGSNGLSVQRTNFRDRFRNLSSQAFTENLAGLLAELNAIQLFERETGEPNPLSSASSVPHSLRKA
jgi:cell filamentation protein